MLLPVGHSLTTKQIIYASKNFKDDLQLISQKCTFKFETVLTILFQKLHTSQRLTAEVWFQVSYKGVFKEDKKSTNNRKFINWK